jgi:hypothetical protein
VGGAAIGGEGLLKRRNRRPANEDALVQQPRPIIEKNLPRIGKAASGVIERDRHNGFLHCSTATFHCNRQNPSQASSAGRIPKPGLIHRLSRPLAEFTQVEFATLSWSCAAR